MLPKDYFSGERADIARFIPAKVSAFLDVGCGEGSFSAALKSATGAEAWGVEIVPEAAHKAGGKVDRLLPGDIEILVDGLPEARFDAVFFNDALEHLRDPYGLLKRLRPKLRPGATVIASIPNVLHFSVLADLLLRKDFRYKDCGIQDSTHLRFFTRKSMRRLFEEQGYTVSNLEPLNQSKNFFYLLVNTLFFGYFKESLVMQYVVVATLGPAAPSPAFIP